LASGLLSFWTGGAGVLTGAVPGAFFLQVVLSWRATADEIISSSSSHRTLLSEVLDEAWRCQTVLFTLRGFDAFSKPNTLMKHLSKCN
jgi:hypothetical protein